MGTNGFPVGGGPNEKTQHIVDDGATADSAIDASEVSVEIEAGAEDEFSGGGPNEKTGH
jgi:hypothetical protein